VTTPSKSAAICASSNDILHKTADTGIHRFAHETINPARTWPRSSDHQLATPMEINDPTANAATPTASRLNCIRSGIIFTAAARGEFRRRVTCLKPMRPSSSQILAWKSAPSARAMATASSSRRRQRATRWHSLRLQLHRVRLQGQQLHPDSHRDGNHINCLAFSPATALQYSSRTLNGGTKRLKNNAASRKPHNGGASSGQRPM